MLFHYVWMLQGLASLWSIMLGGNQSSAILSVAYLPPAIGLGSNALDHQFEVMYPGMHDWKPLPPTAVQLASARGEAKLTLPLERGCALVRLAAH